jgi:hypothetical protein
MAATLEYPHVLAAVNSGIRNNFSGFQVTIAVLLVVTLFIFYALCYDIYSMYCGGTPVQGGVEC